MIHIYIYIYIFPSHHLTAARPLHHFSFLCHRCFLTGDPTCSPPSSSSSRNIRVLSLSLPASSSPSLDLLAPSSSSFQIRCTPQVFGARADRPQPSPLPLLLHYLTAIFASSTPILAVQRLQLRI
ncbi:hypothetical protein HID58_047152 [Brassica napus]|uniref:Uncharacterized protein n=1 Tax=Brassica napus TaxID=3708 RepID=A0ABQ8AYM3_BRANA|nr:hypothetical protein HID58_047152 [Brassica napus]